MIVGWRREVGELLIGKVPLGDHTEIEGVHIPTLGGVQVTGPQGDVVAAHIGER